MTAAEQRTSEAYRRTRRIKITWSSDAARVGRITVGGEYWCGVEWSERRQAWCIEDTEGACLAHAAHIHGRASTKEAAAALAIEMIRDGRMPSPEAAHAAREAHLAGRPERRAKRRAQPAEQRKREERQQREAELSRLATAEFTARRQDENAPALWEALHEVFDFTDTSLWQSNSFAVLRPRLIVHLQAVVARLEYELAQHRKDAATQPFAMYATSAERRRLADRRRRHEEIAAVAVETKLTRAREVLAALQQPDVAAA
jgi:hypothetical protein